MVHSAALSAAMLATAMVSGANALMLDSADGGLHRRSFSFYEHCSVSSAALRAALRHVGRTFTDSSYGEV